MTTRYLKYLGDSLKNENSATSKIIFQIIM
jgi:hypothetical protein